MQAIFRKFCCHYVIITFVSVTLQMVPYTLTVEVVVQETNHRRESLFVRVIMIRGSILICESVYMSRPSGSERHLSGSESTL